MLELLEQQFLSIIRVRDMFAIRQHTSAYVSIRQYLFGRDVFDNIGVLELLEQQFFSIIRVRDMFAFV